MAWEEKDNLRIDLKELREDLIACSYRRKLTVEECRAIKLLAKYNTIYQ